MADRVPGPDLDHFAAVAMGKRAFADAHGLVLVEDALGRHPFPISTNQALACTDGLAWLQAHASGRLVCTLDRDGSAIIYQNAGAERLAGGDTLAHTIALAIVRVGETHGS